MPPPELYNEIIELVTNHDFYSYIAASYHTQVHSTPNLTMRRANNMLHHTSARRCLIMAIEQNNLLWVDHFVRLGATNFFSAYEAAVMVDNEKLMAKFREFMNAAAPALDDSYIVAGLHGAAKSGNWRWFAHFSELYVTVMDKWVSSCASAHLMDMDVDIKDPIWDSIATAAAQGGDRSMIDACVNHKCIVNRDRVLDSVTITAARYGHLDIVIRYKIYVDHARVVFNAACGGHEHIIDEVQGWPERYRGNSDILCGGLFGGHRHLVDRAMSSGATLGWTVAVVWAIMGGHMDMVQICLDNGAKIFEDIIELAMLSNNKDVLRFVLDYLKDHNYWGNREKYDTTIGECMIQAAEECLYDMIPILRR